MSDYSHDIRGISRVEYMRLYAGSCDLDLVGRYIKHCGERVRWVGGYGAVKLGKTDGPRPISQARVMGRVMLFMS